MALKARMDEFLSDVKSGIPMFKLSPAKKIIKEGEQKKDEKMKTKILETWNNLRYDFGAGAYLKKDIPIWILGVCHASKGEIDYVMEEMIIEEGDSENPEIVTQLAKRVFTDFASRPWFTYRTQFPVISGTNITSDTGWGCMLRTAQMMIAQGFFHHHLGRDWRWLQTEDRHKNHVHKKILGWFVDDPGKHCPLSIHHLSQIGRKYGIIPGNWYGPNTVAYIMQQAVEASKERVTELENIAVYVAQDCTVYSQDVYDLCGWSEESESPLKNATLSDSYTESESSEYESAVYVDEIANEVSEITRFSVPEDVTLANRNVNKNLIPMKEFVTSTDINPEVTIGEHWNPRKNSPFLKKKVAKTQTTQNYSPKNTSSAPPPYRRNYQTENETITDNVDLAVIEPCVKNISADNEPIRDNFNSTKNEPIMAYSKPRNILSNSKHQLQSDGNTGETFRTKNQHEQKRFSDKKTAFNAPKSSIRDMFQNLLTNNDGTGIKNERKTVKQESKISSSTSTENQPQTGTNISTIFSNTFKDVFSKLNSQNDSINTEYSNQKMQREREGNTSNFSIESTSEKISLQNDSTSEPSNILRNTEYSNQEMQKELAGSNPNFSLETTNDASFLKNDSVHELGNMQRTTDKSDEEIMQKEQKGNTQNFNLESTSETSPEIISPQHVVESHQEYNMVLQSYGSISQLHNNSPHIDQSTEQSLLNTSEYHDNPGNFFPTPKSVSNSEKIDNNITHSDLEKNPSEKKCLINDDPTNDFASSHCDNWTEYKDFGQNDGHKIRPDMHEYFQVPEHISNYQKEQPNTASIVNFDFDEAQNFMNTCDDPKVIAHPLSHCDIDEDPGIIVGGSRIFHQLDSTHSKSKDVSGISNEMHGQSSPEVNNLSLDVDDSSRINEPISSHSILEQDSSRISPSTQSQTDVSHAPSTSPKNENNQESPKKSCSSAVIILIPVRLGESNLNPIYIPNIQEMLSLESSIGIIGGKPKHSLYFVGFQGEHLLHLDPHYCQVADTPSGYKKNLHNYHTMSIRKTNVKKIDPSCCFGFYCKNANQFEQFKHEVQSNFSSSYSQSTTYPMCLILDGKSGDHHLNSPISNTETGEISQGAIGHKHSIISLPDDDMDDIENSTLVTKVPRSPKKSETRGFSVDDMGAKLNKLIPDASKFYPKFMRQKSSSPVRRKKVTREESLESQFELL